MLYLVPKTPAPSRTKSISKDSTESFNQIAPYKQRFLYDFQEISANLFSFYAQDARYDLRCSLLLDIQDVLAPEDYMYPNEECLVSMVVCDFSTTEGALLSEKAFGNEYIQGILVTRFYLNVLESLFLFCASANAEGLILTIDDHNLDVLEVYRNFIVSETQVITSKGEQTQVMISTNIETHDELIDFTDKVNRDFRQTLWRKQWGNPALREYLKSYALTDF